jgi:hypothetical protein
MVITTGGPNSIAPNGALESRGLFDFRWLSPPAFQLSPLPGLSRTVLKARAYAPASEMKLPADFLKALKSKPKAKKFFETLNKSSRYVIAYGLTTAKKPETRQRRFEKYMDMLVRGEKPDFGFRKKKGTDS